METVIDKYAIQTAWSPEDEAYIAIAVEFAGCLADGKTREEAIANLRVIIGEWLEVANEEGRPIPEPMTFDKFTTPEEAEANLRRLIKQQVDSAVQSVFAQFVAALPSPAPSGYSSDLVRGLIGREYQPAGSED